MAGACPALRSRSAKNSRSTSIARTQVCPLHLVRPSHSATLQPPLWRSVVGNARHRRPKWRSPRLTTTFETEAEAFRACQARFAIESQSMHWASSLIMAKSACFSGAFLPLDRNWGSSIRVAIPPDDTFASCSTKTTSSPRQSHQLSPFSLWYILRCCWVIKSKQLL